MQTGLWLSRFANFLLLFMIFWNVEGILGLLELISRNNGNMEVFLYFIVVHEFLGEYLLCREILRRLGQILFLHLVASFLAWVLDLEFGILEFGIFCLGSFAWDLRPGESEI